MPDSNEPLDPKEATEAKLCAYLEGELQPAERAEIEQHLAVNPQHRQLLADLARTREWMRAIPMESSPVDLAEVFAGQVERSMLLDDSTAGSPGLMTRWPQFAMVAAVLVLMLGLGALIFAMLRGPGSGAGRSGAAKVFSLAPATLPVERLSVVAPPMASAKPVDLSVGVNVPTTPVLPGVPAIAEAMTPAAPPALLRDQSIDSDAQLVKTKLSGLGIHLLQNQPAVSFVISADSPAATVEQVRGFFQRHQLAFDDEMSGGQKPAMALLNFGGATSQPMEATRNNSMAANMQYAQNQQQPITQKADEHPAPTTQPASEFLYVAHGLTQLQLELLSASLASDNFNQTVRRTNLSEAIAPAAPTTSPVGGLVKGQVLTVTVAQLVGPGIDKTNVVRVGEDGTITLPMIDPLPAVGLTAGELEQRIVEKYRETNLIPQATVVVAPASTSTRPVLASTMPATLPTTRAVAAPTTQQGSSASSGITVVVLIERTGSVLPGK